MYTQTQKFVFRNLQLTCKIDLRKGREVKMRVIISFTPEMPRDSLVFDVDKMTFKGGFVVLTNAVCTLEKNVKIAMMAYPADRLWSVETTEEK